MAIPYVYKRADDLGIPVVEATERELVVVTDSDVVNAKKANSKHCALARASLRLPGVVAAYFFRTSAFLEYDDRLERFQLPISVQKEIVSFDRAQVFAAGVYQLSPPPPSSVAGASSERKRRGRRQAKKEARAQERARPSIAIVASQDKPNDLPEQREFDAKLSRLLASQAKHVGGRVVSGIKSSKAPDPLPSKAPTRYVHRTQYVRDLKEPV